MDKSINNVNIIPLKDGEEIPSYLEAKIGKDDFVFIRLEDNKNIFIPKLKVENSILEDINSLLEITSLETLDNNIDDNKSNINNNSIQQNITQSTKW